MNGKLYWITGLSGAGKTTIGKLLYERLKKEKDNVVFLDGDTLREVINRSEYSYEGRKEITYVYSKLCQMLTKQGIDVVCCVVSMFHECREWNRKNIENYFEIYIKVSIETLIKRDQKKLYSQYFSGDITNVMGLDIDFEEPISADLVINNENCDIIKVVDEIAL